MNKEERVRVACDLRNSHKANCCQAVAHVLADQTGLSLEQLYQLAAGFAAGMGNMEGSCGSLIGAVMVAGMATGGNGSVRIAKQILENFREKSGAVQCRTLKGKDDPAVYCSCEDCVRNAVLAYCEVMGIE